MNAHFREFHIPQPIQNWTIAAATKTAMTIPTPAPTAGIVPDGTTSAFDLAIWL